MVSHGGREHAMLATSTVSEIVSGRTFRSRGASGKHGGNHEQSSVVPVAATALRTRVGGRRPDGACLHDACNAQCPTVGAQRSLGFEPPGSEPGNCSRQRPNRCCRTTFRRYRPTRDVGGRRSTPVRRHAPRNTRTIADRHGSGARADVGPRSGTRRSSAGACPCPNGRRGQRRNLRHLLQRTAGVRGCRSRHLERRPSGLACDVATPVVRLRRS